MARRKTDDLRLTVESCLSRWIDLRAAALAPRTIECYRDQLRLHIAPSIGNRPVKSLKPAHVASMLSALIADGHSRTAQLCFVLIRAALKSAVRDGLISTNPCDSLPPPRHRRADPRWWTPDELHSFVESTRESPYSLAWQLALCCGLRRGELAGLRWIDVDLASGLLRIRNQRQRIAGRGLIDAPPKSASGRRDLPIPPGLLPLLERQQLLQQAEALLIGVPPIYVCSPDGSPLAPEALNRALRADLAASGVRPINLHGLRHSMASLAVSLGVPMRVLQDLLGHSSITVTAGTYAHVLRDDQADALDKLAGSVL